MEIQLHYCERGAGVPLVLLHGNGEDGSYFVHQMDYFAQRYRVIAPDTRGHGKSPRGNAPFTLEQFAQDLKDTLDRLGLKRILLLGFSDGANIALIFTLRWPRYVEKLVLNGGNLDPKGVKWTVQLPIWMGYGLVRLLETVDRRARPKRELLELMVKQPDLRPEQLSAIRRPTLVVAGERDMIRREHTACIARPIPGAELAVLPGGHFLAHENSGPFNRRVEEFLLETGESL